MLNNSDNNACPNFIWAEGLFFIVSNKTAWNSSWAGVVITPSFIASFVFIIISCLPSVYWTIVPYSLESFWLIFFPFKYSFISSILSKSSSILTSNFSASFLVPSTIFCSVSAFLIVTLDSAICLSISAICSLIGMWKEESNFAFSSISFCFCTINSNWSELTFSGDTLEARTKSVANILAFLNPLYCSWYSGNGLPFSSLGILFISVCKDFSTSLDCFIISLYAKVFDLL